VMTDRIEINGNVIDVEFHLCQEHATKDNQQEAR
jgi:hypothetical protein